MITYLQHEVTRVRGVRHEACVALQPEADAVVLSGQILHALEVERLHNAVSAQVVLGAAARSLEYVRIIIEIHIPIAINKSSLPQWATARRPSSPLG